MDLLKYQNMQDCDREVLLKLGTENTPLDLVFQTLYHGNRSTIEDVLMCPSPDFSTWNDETLILARTTLFSMLDRLDTKRNLTQLPQLRLAYLYRIANVMLVCHPILERLEWIFAGQYSGRLSRFFNITLPTFFGFKSYAKPMTYAETLYRSSKKMKYEM